MGSMSYEAELQRQHPRYRLPMHAKINEKSYTVGDWSMNGFAIDAGKGFAAGIKHTALLTVPFDGYEFGIVVKAEVLYASGANKRTSFLFVELDQRQAGLLQYVTDALLSGEIVSAGDVLDVARRSEIGKSRQLPAVAKTSSRARIAAIGRRAVTTGAVLAIGAALCSFLWSNVYQELYIVESQTANVSAKMVNLASPSVGRISYLNEHTLVKIGQPLMTINPAVGDPITVQSPCDCLQVDRRFANGDFVKTGDTVVRLMRDDAPIVVSAIIPADKLMSLYGVKTANIVYADGSRVDNADILWLPGQGDVQKNLPRDPFTVILNPRRPLSAEMLGQPVHVQFDLFAQSLIGRLVQNTWAKASGVTSRIFGSFGSHL